MSGSNYAQTQDEIAGMLGMSRQQFSKYASRPDAPRKQRSGYNIAQWREYVQAVQKTGLKGDGSLRDEKLLREIERLDIMIQKDRGELVDRAETMAQLRGILCEYRAAIEAWRQHQSAKMPGLVAEVEALADDLITRIARTADERD